MAARTGQAVDSGLLRFCAGRPGRRGRSEAGKRFLHPEEHDTDRSLPVQVTAIFDGAESPQQRAQRSRKEMADRCQEVRGRRYAGGFYGASRV